MRGRPEDFKDLRPAEFLMRVNSLRAEGGLAGQTLIAVRSHADTLFTAINLAETQLEYRTLLGLYQLAHPKFEWLNTQPGESGKKQSRNALLSRHDEWTGRSYEALRAKVLLMEWLKVNHDIRIAEVRRWLAAGHTIAEMRAEELGMLRHALGDYQEIRKSFVVDWEGTLTAPRTGNYTFHISPINPYSYAGGANDARLSGSERRHRDSNDAQKTVRLAIERRMVLFATPDKWVSTSKPVALTAGKPVSIRMRVNVNVVNNLPKKSLHALLAWEGPRIETSIVPHSQLAPPGGAAGEGLKMTYYWQTDNQRQSVSRIVPMVDEIWADNRVLLYSDLALDEQIGDALFTKVMSSDYLDGLEDSGGVHAFLGDPNLTDGVAASAFLSAARRKAFLKMLLTRPALLDPVSTTQARDLYQTFRLGNPEEALDVFGLWASRHADIESWIPNSKPFNGFDKSQRSAYVWLARRMTRELPSHIARLESEFLEAPEGGCRLPAAYILETSYAGRGKLDEWIAKLESRLENDAVEGDGRVNWLLARAHAEEIRHGDHDRYDGDEVRPLAGRSWIDKALVAAETAAVRQRVAKELAARLTADGRYPEARDVLDKEAGKAAAAVVWRAEIDAFEAAGVIERKGGVRQETQDQLARLRRRRDRAKARGDKATAAKYEAMIKSLKSQQ